MTKLDRLGEELSHILDKVEIRALDMETMVVAYRTGFNAMLAEHERLVKPLLWTLEYFSRQYSDGVYDIPKEAAEVLEAYKKETE